MRKIRYAMEYVFAKTLLMFFSLIPVQYASSAGGLLSKVLFFPSSRTRVARHNIRRALPEITDSDVDKIIKEMWDNLGRNFAELPHVGRLTKDEIKEITEIEGANQLHKISDNQASILFFTAHLGNWEIAPRVFSDLGLPVNIVYRPANNPGIEKLIQKAREPFVINTIPKGSAGSRMMIQKINQGERIGMLVDQKMNDGIAIDFFGHKAMTAPAIAKLAIKFRCPVVPVQVIRTKGCHFKIIVSAPIEIQHTSSRDDDIIFIMNKIYRLLEDWIRANPGQWIWLHNRWPRD